MFDFQANLSVILVILILIQTAFSYQNGCYGPPLKSENGYALTNKTFQTLPAKSFSDCLTACISHILCMSINFHTINEECELNSQTNETLPALYKRREHSIYMTNILRRAPGNKWEKYIGDSCRGCVHFCNTLTFLLRMRILKNMIHKIGETRPTWEARINGISNARFAFVFSRDLLAEKFLIACQKLTL